MNHTALAWKPQQCIAALQIQQSFNPISTQSTGLYAEFEKTTSTHRTDKTVPWNWPPLRPKGELLELHTQATCGHWTVAVFIFSPESVSVSVKFGLMHALSSWEVLSSLATCSRQSCFWYFNISCLNARVAIRNWTAHCAISTGIVHLHRHSIRYYLEMHRSKYSGAPRYRGKVSLSTRLERLCRNCQILYHNLTYLQCRRLPPHSVKKTEEGLWSWAEHDTLEICVHDEKWWWSNTSSKAWLSV